MKKLLLGFKNYLDDSRASIGEDRDSSRSRANSAINEKGVSDKIEAMKNTKDMTERWELERTLNRYFMTEEEKARWEVNAEHKHPSILKIFGLVIACICGAGLPFSGFLAAILHSASNKWAQWLWFSAAMLGGVLVDAHAFSI
ncbi:hypothetical protein TrLO_g6717 [Triparma laevis f. longispina]|uniref:Uncharacterized protein n=1 Tax=Triparma laevis f. longispina TaxID=1714387 RepID=A0A9W7FNF3_9STRA|nr:hypothetical protein TrLO_g6717 [Triparma laevis f. longispina]